MASKADFSVIYASRTHLASAQTKRICILDSSFNPPHLGHFALAKEALRYPFEGSTSHTLLLLLLSVKNVDKAPVPASFEHRLNMMYLMAQYMEQNLHVDVSIGLTSHAKFVDKAVSVNQHLKSLFPDNYLAMKLTFLVGFDTLIRILDPKYYLPDKLLDSLNDFMKTTDLFCLTRKDAVSTYQQQADYVKHIQLGKMSHIPLAWADSLHLYTVEDETGDVVGLISSSQIRNAADKSDIQTVDAIKDYIRQHLLYT